MYLSSLWQFILSVSFPFDYSPPLVCKTRNLTTTKTVFLDALLLDRLRTFEMTAVEFIYAHWASLKVPYLSPSSFLVFTHSLLTFVCLHSSLWLHNVHVSPPLTDLPSSFLILHSGKPQWPLSAVSPQSLSLSVSVSFSPHFLPVLALLLRGKQCVCFRIATEPKADFDSLLTTQSKAVQWDISSLLYTLSFHSITIVFHWTFCPTGAGILFSQTCKKFIY